MKCLEIKKVANFEKREQTNPPDHLVAMPPDLQNSNFECADAIRVTVSNESNALVLSLERSVGVGGGGDTFLFNGLVLDLLALGGELLLFVASSRV